MKFPELIPVSNPTRPPQERLDALFSGIWNRAWLTNDGPLVRRLESELSEYLEIPDLVTTANGTLAIQLILRAWGCTSGEVITTPFTFIATATSAVWQGLTPVFADIDPETWNIDPGKVAELVGLKTRAILATHVFGNPCDVNALEKIGREAGIPVFYDAAHTFGVRHRGRSLLSYGDAAAISFHATKTFHTAEGGAIAINHSDRLQHLRHMRNFGYTVDGGRDGLGINAKMSEFHAAIGLALLPELEGALQKRNARWSHYKSMLSGLPGVHFQKIQPETRHNAAYAAILLPGESILLQARKALRAAGYDSRRYFFPSLDTLPVFNAESSAPVSRDIASRILCVPLYPDLEHEKIDEICEIIANAVTPASTVFS